MTSWNPIGTTNPQDLTESRIQLHYAIQFIAATGAALAEPLPDYSHTSLEWNPVLEVFVGTVIRVGTPFRVALDPYSLTSVVLNQQNETLATLPLHGTTMANGLNWLKLEIAKLGADANLVEFLSYPPDDFPDHPLARNARFDASHVSALSDLAGYYANTHRLLQQIIATEEASAIHIWPHHFDIATLITLPGINHGNPLTIGVGLSPGDTSYAEPYWYVSPYPYPDTAYLPALEGDGSWHTQHWVGAVLKASQVVKNESPTTQQQQVAAFLRSALTASKTLLQAESPAQV